MLSDIIEKLQEFYSVNILTKSIIPESSYYSIRILLSAIVQVLNQYRSRGFPLCTAIYHEWLLHIPHCDALCPSSSRYDANIGRNTPMVLDKTFVNILRSTNVDTWFMTFVLAH